MKIGTLTIVGVGLIGGSIGLAARRRGLCRRVVGVGRRPETLEVARARGAIDAGVTDLEPGVREADVVAFCTPVEQVAGQVLAAARVVPRGTLLTDAGSTKAVIARTVEQGLTAPVPFIGGHPLAGSEKSGPEHASADLFEGRLTVLTPTPRTDPVALERAHQFWYALGARTRVMDPEAHDRALALTSHLPHLAAAALAGLISPEQYELAAGGWKDTTRIAAGDPGLWSAIFDHNRPALLSALARFEDRLAAFREALAAGDDSTIRHLLDQAKRARDALGS